MSEEKLLEIIFKTLNSWVDEEMELNGESNVSRDQRYVENLESLIESITDA
tara:strand:+ start:374 stop:526 length:153 start_codon:yes stop_codon:yes gene_type:complete